LALVLCVHSIRAFCYYRDAILIITETSLGFLLNLISADLRRWYSEHLVIVWVIIGILVIVGAILKFASE
jgi:hypothetical protein